jgi:hypothetical protein
VPGAQDAADATAPEAKSKWLPEVRPTGRRFDKARLAGTRRNAYLEAHV